LTAGRAADILAAMRAHVRGTFEVKLTPRPPEDGVIDAPVARLTIDKRFHGELDASSRGEMLAVRTDVEASAGYVALERVTGMLGGRRGSFALQHCGTMDRGTASLSVTVVPDSGTGELVGLTGTMAIEITDGQHVYDFDYALASAGD